MAWNYPPNSAAYYSYYCTQGLPATDEASTSGMQSPPSSYTAPAETSESANLGGLCATSTRYQYTYSLRIINPKKRSQFSVEKFRRDDKFKSPRELRLCVLSECEGSVPDNTEFDIGYFKGRGSAKVWIKSEDDLKCMYDAYSKGSNTEISMWCLGREQSDHTDSASSTKKRQHPDGDEISSKPVSKRQAIREEVDDIFSTLTEKHASTYTPAQLRLWANMLQIGTHRDYDTPPKVPMFGTSAKTGTKGPNLTEALSSVAEGFMRALKSPGPTPSGSSSPTQASSRAPLQDMGVSPGKCAALRTQYIQQLMQLHQLLEATAISKEEYDKLKDSILCKMQEL